MKIERNLMGLTFSILISSCGSNEQSYELSYKLYDPAEYPSLLINKVDTGTINVFIVGEESLLKHNIAESIKMWTSIGPIPVVTTAFVTDLSSADLLIEIVTPFEGRKQQAYLTPFNRPVITLFENHNKKTLMHEIGHAFGMQDTYYAYHNSITGVLESTCNIYEDQPKSMMCLSQNGEYKLYEDDKLGIVQLYNNRIR